MYELMEKITGLNVLFTTAIVSSPFPKNIGLRLAYKFVLERAVPVIKKGRHDI